MKNDMKNDIIRKTRGPIVSSFLEGHPQWRLLKDVKDASPSDGVIARTAEEVYEAASRGIPDDRVFFLPLSKTEWVRLSSFACHNTCPDVHSDAIRSARPVSGPGNIFTMCRFIAAGMEDLILLNEAAQNAGKATGKNEIAKAALRLWWGHSIAGSPCSGLYTESGSNTSADPACGLRSALQWGRSPGNITHDDLADIAHEIKKLRHVTVRGCFFAADLDGVHGKELGRYFRAAYETAKRMTVTLPCAMPYICCEGALDALFANEKTHPQSLPECLRALEIMTEQNETAFYAKLYLT